ncbi:MAG: hypothetical protein ACO1RX_20180 [Candidatus Sericytochromatia bacterium]
MKNPAAELEYFALRQELRAKAELTDAEVDDWIREALDAFRIANTDVQGCVLQRTSTETKIRALKELLK